MSGHVLSVHTARAHVNLHGHAPVNPILPLGRFLEKFDTVRDKKLEPKHAALFFENIVKAPNTAQQLTPKNY